MTYTGSDYVSKDSSKMPKGIQSSNGLQFVSNENRGYNDGSIYIKKRGNGHRTYSKASI